MAKADPFHDHLDKCERCRNQPFNLCPIGDALLVQSAAQSYEHLGIEKRQAKGKVRR